jgi:hypothetical protein
LEVLVTTSWTFVNENPTLWVGGGIEKKIALLHEMGKSVGKVRRNPAKPDANR